MNEKIYNQKTPNNNNHPSYSGIFGLLAIALAFTGYYATQSKTERELKKAQTAMKKNETARNAYISNAYDFTQIEKMCNRIDSLNERNSDLVSGVFETYFEKLDKKYTLGKFLDATQISKINDVIITNLNKTAKPDDLVYKYVKSCVPMNARTPLRTFEDIVDRLCITPVELMPYGVEFDGGEIFQFYKPTAQNLFYKYLDELYTAYSNDTEPNFHVKELAPAQDEYEKNCKKILELESSIARTDSIFNANMARFDTIRDSLNRVIKNLKSKLK